MKGADPIKQDIEGGDFTAADELLMSVYTELRRLAAAKMAREKPGHTLQPTALVHEVWLRLSNQPERRFFNRAHFFAAAADAMRRILVDNARRKNSQRRGGEMNHIEIESCHLASPQPDDELQAISEAVDRLATEDKVMADLVKLRYFVGMTSEEAAEALGISSRTAKRYWVFARAWLHNEISK